MRRKIFILLGLPGSGKGTQGAKLADDLMIPHISTGDIFRDIVQTDAPEASLLKDYMSQGKLIPSDIVNKTVRTYILSDKCRNGCILDGYPRNLSQAEYFVENIDADIVAILFESTEEVVTKRITGRFNCKNCGKLYNKFFLPPATEGVCDSCGSTEFNYREDDEEETIIKRLKEYNNETIPLVEYYREKARLFAVDADKKESEVFEELSSIVKKV